MSDATRDRIAVLQHKRRQSEAYGALSSISDTLGEAPHPPIDSSYSLRLQGAMYERLKGLRDQQPLRSQSYTTAEAAVNELLIHASSLTSDMMAEFYNGARGTGFFYGPFSRGFLLACLLQGYEGMALVQPDLALGVLLDVALDDPIRGDFYEVEWW